MLAIIGARAREQWDFLPRSSDNRAGGMLTLSTAVLGIFAPRLPMEVVLRMIATPHQRRFI